MYIIWWKSIDTVTGRIWNVAEMVKTLKGHTSMLNVQGSIYLSGKVKIGSKWFKLLQTGLVHLNAKKVMLKIEINNDSDILISDSFCSMNVIICLLFSIFRLISFDSFGLKSFSHKDSLTTISSDGFLFYMETYMRSIFLYYSVRLRSRFFQDILPKNYGQKTTTLIQILF